MDAEYAEETSETHVTAKRRKRLSKFTRAVQKKKPKFNPGNLSNVFCIVYPYQYFLETFLQPFQHAV